MTILIFNKAISTKLNKQLCLICQKLSSTVYVGQLTRRQRDGIVTMLDKCNITYQVIYDYSNVQGYKIKSNICENFDNIQLLKSN